MEKENPKKRKAQTTLNFASKKKTNWVCYRGCTNNYIEKVEKREIEGEFNVLELEKLQIQIFTMVAISLAKKLKVEHSCSQITNTVRSMPLNYNIVETPSPFMWTSESLWQRMLLQL